tara:strand:+ start:160 stop:810 length:651 start_codon:yes stop_codon:yes gene_type:complete
MSQPRKAMMEMGFQGCCLRCDAKDVANLPRCGNCIEIHRQIRNMIAENDGSSELLQHMSDLFQMLSNPEKYDNDEMHGKELVKQQRLIRNVDYERGFQYPNEIENLFSKDISKTKSLMSDLINKNPWKNKPPSSDVARIIGEETWLEEELSNISYDGKKTVPSKKIEPIDRSDRLGEDLDLLKNLELNSEAEVEEIKRKRKSLDDVISSLDEILDN